MIKADCFYGEPEYRPEIAGFAIAVKNAITKFQYPLRLFWSPGNRATFDQAQWAVDNGYAGAALRITGDMWDYWWHVLRAFTAAATLAPLIGKNGAILDLDLLPLGYGYPSDSLAELRALHWTDLTLTEQRTAMTLWSFARSPLIISCALPVDKATLSLLLNRGCLEVQNGTIRNRQIWRSHDQSQLIWTAQPAYPSHRFEAFAALFNLASAQDPDAINPIGPQVLRVHFIDLGLPERALGYTVVDEWTNRPIGTFVSNFSAVVEEHGVVFVRVYADS